MFNICCFISKFNRELKTIMWPNPITWPFDLRWATSYGWSIVIMHLSCTVNMAPQNIGVTTLTFRGHVTSSVTRPFGSANVVSHWWSIVTIRLTFTVREIWRLKDNGVTTLTFWGHVTSPGNHHHQARAPSWSVEVSTRCFQCSRSWAHLQAELRPWLWGWRSAPRVRSHVWRGRPGGRFHSMGRPRIDVLSALEMSSDASILATWPKSRSRLLWISWDSCGGEPAWSRTVALATWSMYSIREYGADRCCQKHQPCLAKLVRLVRGQCLP